MFYNPRAMSLLLYTTEYPDPLPETQFRSLADRLPVDLRQKVLKYRRWQDAYGSLFGKLLLQIAMKKAGFPFHLDQLKYTAFNKPYLPQLPDFNISHSGHRVVCIISTHSRIGIDVEAISDISFDDFQNQFTPEEWIAIRRSPTPVNTFYQFWTAKESIIKADGRGLGIPLQDLDICKNRTIILDTTYWTIHDLALFPDYACHIAVETTAQTPQPAANDPNNPPDVPVIEIHHLTPAEILAAIDLQTAL